MIKQVGKRSFSMQITKQLPRIGSPSSAVLQLNDTFLYQIDFSFADKILWYNADVC